MSLDQTKLGKLAKKQSRNMLSREVLPAVIPVEKKSFVHGSFYSDPREIIGIGNVSGTELNRIAGIEIKCQHLELQFFSGDYYVVCKSCGTYWVIDRAIMGDKYSGNNLCQGQLRRI